MARHQSGEPSLRVSGCGGAATKEQHGLAHGSAALSQRRALLEKATERRDTGAGADHDHRQVRIVGRAKRNRGLADEAIHGGIDPQPGQVVGADTLKSPLAAACGCLQFTCRRRYPMTPK
jgi:hypothetical protein